MNLEQRLWTHLTILSEDIGERPVGTEGNRKATDYISRVFSELGYIVQRQPFPCVDWRVDESFIEMNGKRREVPVNSFSKSCDVTGAVRPFCTLEVLENATVRDEVVLLYGDLSKEPVTPKGFTIYNPDHHQRLIRTLEDQRPAAVILVHHHTGTQVPLINDWDFGIPSITVHPEFGIDILNASTDVRLCIRGTRRPVEVANVLAKKFGRKEERIVISAHFDTFFGTTGAIDNSAGVACLLTLAKQLVDKDLSYGLEFIAFNGEEYQGIGSAAYVKTTRQFERIVAAINIDGVGQRLGNTTITTMSGSPTFEQGIRNVKAAYPDVLWSAPWYDSDHFHFFANGVPTIPVRSVGLTDIFHSQKDVLHWASPAKLVEAVSLVADAIECIEAAQPNDLRPAQGQN